MVDYRMFRNHLDKLPSLPADDDWTCRWNERVEAVRAVFGETVVPNQVHSFSWKDYILPGACALTFKARPPDTGYLYMSLGLSQPLSDGNTGYPWEFAVRAHEHTEWPIDLLYQLLSQWLWEKGDIWFGYSIPLTFFIGADGKMWPSIADPTESAVGEIRRLYLWKEPHLFQVSSGAFGLLTVVAVTEDEEQLACDTTPAHLMLLLRKMNVGRICEPRRTSVLNVPGATEAWATIKRMTHDAALHAIEATQ